MIAPFQFHKGTIRTARHFHCIACVLVFQFHKGTIRTIIRCCVHGLPRNFNSIKVRLEQPASVAKLPVLLFQFHKGTIRTKDSIYNIVYDSEFQFHKGTIRTCHPEEVGVCFPPISIP